MAIISTKNRTRNPIYGYLYNVSDIRIFVPGIQYTDIRTRNPIHGYIYPKSDIQMSIPASVFDIWISIDYKYDFMRKEVCVKFMIFEWL